MTESVNNSDNMTDFFTAFQGLPKKVSMLYSDVNYGKIMNRPQNLNAYDQDIIDNTPQMIGKSNVQALQEVHVFFLPIWKKEDNLDQKLINVYQNIVKLYNEHMKNKFTGFKVMKDPILSLKYTDRGYLTVMQSSLYVLSNDKREVIEICHKIADLFSQAGLNVVREKIEASAFGIDGIPQTDEEAKKFNKYFEFHIRVQRKGEGIDVFEPLSDAELVILENASENLTAKFKVPVPLSYNRSKEETNGGYQRYLNIRFRKKGMGSISQDMAEITDYIHRETPFKIIKTISEYVWYDTFTKLDEGWIDF